MYLLEIINSFLIPVLHLNVSHYSSVAFFLFRGGGGGGGGLCGWCICMYSCINLSPVL